MMLGAMGRESDQVMHTETHPDATNPHGIHCNTKNKGTDIDLFKKSTSLKYREVD